MERDKNRSGQYDALPFRRPRGGPGAALAAPVERAKDARRTLKRLSSYLKPHKTRLFLVAFTAILSTVFTIAAPKIMGLAITELFRASVSEGNPGSLDFSLIYKVLIALTVLYLLSSAFRYIMSYIMASVSLETTFTLRKDITDKLHRLPISWFDRHSHGDILSRVTNDLDTVANTMQQSITELVIAGFSMAGVILMMIIISPLLTIVSIVVLPLSILMTRTIAKKSQRFFVRQQKVLGQMNGHVEEMITGHELVKAFGREQSSLKRFLVYNEELNQLGWKANFISGLVMPLMHVINNLGYIIIAVVGGILVAAGKIPIGDIQAFIQYSKQFGQPVIQVSQIINIIQSTIASAERVFEVLDETEERRDNYSAGQKTGISPGSFMGHVEIKKLYFSYETEKPLLQDLNLQVLKGQSVAIVGPTGAGKTTLVNLLLRFYEINSGIIMVDGIDIRNISRNILRSIFGMVLQDTWLFQGTLYDNIAYGCDNPSKDAVLKASKAAQADHFIRTLPDGYSTIINEEGSNISAGQKQLITIARAFLKDPAILILDEATSSVDTRTEVLIQNAMRNLMKGRTSFIIAHRLSTIKNADIILVMNRGQIIEQGSHRHLLRTGGFYAELYRSQYT